MKTRSFAIASMAVAAFALMPAGATSTSAADKLEAPTQFSDATEFSSQHYRHHRHHHHRHGGYRYYAPPAVYVAPQYYAAPQFYVAPYGYNRPHRYHHHRRHYR